MKLQLDTITKTIKVEGTVNFGTLVETLEQLLPNNKWKEFSLETSTTIINWPTYPIITYPTWPTYPTYPVQPWITWCATGEATDQTDYRINSGVYNISILS